MAKKSVKSAASKASKPVKPVKAAAKPAVKEKAPAKVKAVPAPKAVQPAVVPTALARAPEVDAPVEKPAKKSKKELKKEVADAAITAEANKRWLELKGKHGGEKAVPYNMTATYAAHSSLVHKKFGWGFVLQNENDRLEVLFEHGSKHLISNYKG
jgi:hypothetical protein